MLRLHAVVCFAFVVLHVTVWALPLDDDFLTRSPSQTVHAKISTHPHRYIVVLHPRQSESSQTYLHKHLKSLETQPNIVHRYYHHVTGYAGHFNESDLDQIRRHKDVLLIEPDRSFNISDTEYNPPSWGIDRIDQINLPLDGAFSYPTNAGLGVNIHVLDTGIYTGHETFGGRAYWGVTTVKGAANADGNGHGTHVAGTSAGSDYGIAKSATLYAVKAIADNGNGLISDVIAGLDWISEFISANPYSKNVINMSLGGGGLSAALDMAATAVVQNGAVIVVAAGNNAQDACLSSPGHLSNVITVGATDVRDTFAYFSNYGSCVDINAPGVAITSSYIGFPTASQVLTGTSMSTPHVTGVAATIRAQHPLATPAQIQHKLLSLANNNVLSSVPPRTVNSLLYNGY